MRILFGTAVLILLLLQALRLPLQSLAMEAQRDYIARTYCINLDEPELLCSGQCYIDRSLAETVKKDRKSVPLPQLSLEWEPGPYLPNPAIPWPALLSRRSCAEWPYSVKAGKEYAYLPFTPPRC